LPLLDAATVSGQVRPRLVELSNDRDKDVQFFALQALQSC